MRITMKWATWTAIVVVWTVIFAVSGAAKAADAGGSVSGMVTKDGKGVPHAKVLLIKAPLKGAGQGRRLKGAATTSPSGGESAGPNRPKPVGQTTTDGEGKFSLSGLPAGTYIVIAGEKGEGRAHKRVIVSDGKSASVTLILVRPGNAGANRRATGGKQAKA